MTINIKAMTEKILAFLAAALGGGWLAQILFMRYEKRKKAAESKDAEIDVDAKEDMIRDKKLSDAYDRIVQLQEIADKERDKWVKVSEELTEMKLEVLREREARKLAEFSKCTVSGCPNRQPPRIDNNG